MSVLLANCLVEKEKQVANTETIVLRLTPSEADSLAYVLQSALVNVTMLDSERRDATNCANALFDQLKYGHWTTCNGVRMNTRPEVMK